MINAEKYSVLQSQVSNENSNLQYNYLFHQMKIDKRQKQANNLQQKISKQNYNSNNQTNGERNDNSSQKNSDYFRRQSIIEYNENHLNRQFTNSHYPQQKIRANQFGSEDQSSKERKQIKKTSPITIKKSKQYILSNESSSPYEEDEQTKYCDESFKKFKNETKLYFKIIDIKQKFDAGKKPYIKDAFSYFVNKIIQMGSNIILESKRDVFYEDVCFGFTGIQQLRSSARDLRRQQQDLKKLIKQKQESIRKQEQQKNQKRLSKIRNKFQCQIKMKVKNIQYFKGRSERLQQSLKIQKQKYAQLDQCSKTRQNLKFFDQKLRKAQRLIEDNANLSIQKLQKQYQQIQTAYERKLQQSIHIIQQLTKQNNQLKINKSQQSNISKLLHNDIDKLKTALEKAKQSQKIKQDKIRLELATYYQNIFQQLYKQNKKLYKEVEELKCDKNQLQVVSQERFQTESTVWQKIIKLEEQFKCQIEQKNAKDSKIQKLIQQFGNQQLLEQWGKLK